MIILTEPLSRKETEMPYGINVSYESQKTSLSLTMPGFVKDDVVQPGVYNYSVGLTKSGKGVRLNGKDDGTISIVGSRDVVYSGITTERQDLIAASKSIYADTTMRNDIRKVEGPAIIKTGDKFAVVSKNSVKEVSKDNLKDYCEKNGVQYPFAFSKPLECETQKQQHDHAFHNVLKNSWIVDFNKDEIITNITNDEKEMMVREMTDAVNKTDEFFKLFEKQNAYELAAKLAATMDKPPAYLDELKPFDEYETTHDIRTMYADRCVNINKEIDFEKYAPSKECLCTQYAKGKLMPCFMPQEQGGTGKYETLLQEAIKDYKDNYFEMKESARGDVIAKCLETGLLDETQLEREIKADMIMQKPKYLNVLTDIKDILTDEEIISICASQSRIVVDWNEETTIESGDGALTRSGIKVLDEAGIMPPEAYKELGKKLGNMVLTQLNNTPEELKETAMEERMQSHRFMQEIIKAQEQELTERFGAEKAKELLYRQNIHTAQEQPKPVAVHHKTPDSMVHENSTTVGLSDRPDNNSTEEMFNPALDMSKFGDVVLMNEDSIGIEEEMESQEVERDDIDLA